MQVKHQREMEELRNQIRVLTSEVDRLTFKQQTADDEKLKYMHKVEKKTHEMTTLHQEKATLTQTLREKDLILDQL